MEKYKKYYGVIIFVATIVVFGLIAYYVISPRIVKFSSLRDSINTKEEELSGLQVKLNTVKTKIKKIKDSISGSQKRIYTPMESDLGNDSLFFTLYDDVIEMVRANNVKIKSIDYNYNPENDEFVKFGKDVYFVCDVNMDIVSNYINLGKLIQDLYQYPYYIKINSIETKPYAKDKKTLLSSLSIRLYAHTEPEVISNKGTEE